MTISTERLPTEVAGRVAQTIDGVFSVVDGWRTRLERFLSEPARLTADRLDTEVSSFAATAVSTYPLLSGAGFVAAPGLLDDAPWHLAWWLSGTGADRRARRLETIDDPSHEQFRDYTALEWWRLPVITGGPHLTGPYVDYVCTDDYTLTFTAPVVAGGRLAGVVGADAVVDRLERTILPQLRSGPTPATVVNASGRVVASTDPRRQPGSILRTPGLPEALAAVRTSPAVALGEGQVLACGASTLALVTGA